MSQQTLAWACVIAAVLLFIGHVAIRMRELSAQPKVDEAGPRFAPQIAKAMEEISKAAPMIAAGVVLFILAAAIMGWLEIDFSAGAGSSESPTGNPVGSPSLP